VLKVLNTGRMKGQVEPVIIEDIPVFPSGLPVITLQIHSRYHGDWNSARLVVMSRGELRSVPLHRCRHRTTCSYVLLTYLLLVIKMSSVSVHT